MREIEEIHKAISAPTAPLSNQPKKPPTTRMASHIDPKDREDEPIRRIEYDCNVDYVERTLCDHNRRLRAVEISQDSSERKGAKVDSDYYMHMNVIHRAQEKLSSEVLKVKESVKALIESQTKPVQFEGRELPYITRNVPNAIVGQRKEMEQSSQRFTSPHPTAGDVSAGKRQPQRGSSTYGMFMRAATKVVPPANESRPQVTQPAYELSVETATREKRGKTTGGSGNYGRPGPTYDMTRESQTSRPSNTKLTFSTPIQEKGRTATSWADDDDYDDNVVDEFIASVVIQDESPDRGAPRESSRAIATEKPAAGEPLNTGLPQRQPRQTTRNGGTTAARVGGTSNLKNGGAAQPKNGGKANNGNGGAASRKTGGPSGGEHGGPKNGGAANGGMPNGTGGFNINGAAVQMAAQQAANAPTDRGGAIAAGTGARPKQQVSGKQSNVFVDNQNVDVPPPMLDNPDVSFAKVVTRNGWHPPQAGKRRRMRSSPTSIAPLRGAQMKQMRDIYVRGLERKNYRTSEEVEDAVYFYCKERGVEVLYVKEIKNRFETEIACVKVTVLESNWAETTDFNFWPEGTEVREWFQNGRSRRPSSAYHEERDL